MKNIISKSWKLFPWIWMIVGTVFDIWYQIVPGKWILDSDLAAEMVLANHLNQTHRILSTGWNYSTELRVFESQWFYRIGLLLSPHDWHMARVIAAILLYLVFITILLSFAKGIGLGEYAPWLAAILMWPFGRWYLVYGLYGTYYMIYMLFSMTVTLVAFRLLRMQQEDRNGKKGKIALLYGLGLFCSLGSGLNGIKQALVFFIPLFLTAVVVAFLAAYKNNVETFSDFLKKCRAEWLFCANSILFSAVNGAGCLINLRVLNKIYNFEHFDDMYFMDGRKYRLYDIALDFLMLFGYEKDVPVQSGAGLIGVLGVAFAGGILLCLIRLNFRYKKLDLKTKILVLLFDVSLAFQSVIYCLMGNYKDYYFLAMFPFVFALVLLELKTEPIPMRGFRTQMLIFIALVVALLSVGTVRQEMADPYFTTGGYAEATEFLLDKNLTDGYASFWNSAVLREMSSGQIETWTLYNVNDSFLKYGWLQEQEKMDTDPEGRCFLLINEEVDGSVENSILVQNGSGELVYQDGSIYIYEFEAPSQIQNALDEFFNGGE